MLVFIIFQNYGLNYDIKVVNRNIKRFMNIFNKGE